MRRALAAALLGGLAAPVSAEWKAARPAYRAVERLSDGLYGALRGGLFTTVLPRRLTRHMAAAPEKDSYADFRRELARNQERASRRIVEARPAGVSDTPAAQARWRAFAAAEQQDALAGAFAATMVGRYDLESFGQSSGAYASDRSNWEPAFLAPAAVLGSAYLWAAGVDAGWRAGRNRLGLRLAPGWRWRSAGGARRLASLDLSREGFPLAVRADWGGSGPDAESVSLTWSQRF